MTRISVAVPLALALSVVTAVGASPVSLEREFTFGPERFHLKPGAAFTEIKVDGASPSLDVGRPELPWVARMVELPPGTKLTGVEVIDLVTEPWAEATRLPSAWTMAPGGAPERSKPDPAYFERSGFQPVRLVEIGPQGFQQGKGVAPLRLCPVRWDAATGRLERVTRIKLRLVIEATSAEPTPRLRNAPWWKDSAPRLPERSGPATMARESGGGRSEAFSATQVPSLLGSPVEYVIVTTEALAAEFQRLADWKTQAGCPAVVRTLSFIRSEYPRGADDAERLRDFIRDAYSRWGTKWILLGGDTDVIPTRYAPNTYFGGETIATDLYFSCLDGNWDSDGDHLFGEGYVNVTNVGDDADLFPEVYVGRAPVSTLGDAQAFVDRTLEYTRTPVGDYERAVLIFAEVLFPEDWKQGDGALLDGGTIGDELLDLIDDNASMRAARLYQNWTDPGWEPGVLPETKEAVLDSLGQGYGFSVHIGHGYRNVMSVADGNLTNSDAQALPNGNRLTNLYAVNCTSNAIDFPCIGEAFMHAAQGGAVTVVGSTRLDFPYAARVFQKEFFRLVFDDSTTAAGEAQAKQKVPLIPSSYEDNAYRWQQLSLLLLGDPELRFWTGTPRTLSVTHPGSFALNDTAIAVTVLAGGQPLEGARVTAYKASEGYLSGPTDAAGHVVLPFHVDSPGNVTLTVTGYDCRPYQAAIPVTPSAVPVLADQAPVLDDDASGGTNGDSDGVWDAGETIDLRVPVRNAGGAQADGVAASIATTDPLVTVVAPGVVYGSIPPGQTVTSAGAFRISIPASAPDQREVPFTLSIVDNALRRRDELVLLTVRAVDLRHYGHVVTDVGGNSDGQPNPGETVTYALKFVNLGTGDAHTVSAILRRLDGLSTVSDSTSIVGEMAPGEERSGDAVVFVPNSASARFELRVSDSRGLRYVQPMDLVTPAVPTGLAGLGAASKIRLTWEPVAASDLLGYNVYRSPSQGGPFTRANKVPTDRIATYEDGPLAPLTRYYYRVTSVDSSGNESAPSAVTSASTNPPTHGSFPIPMKATSTRAPVAVDHMFQGYAYDVAAGADVLYLWHSDGTAPVDADGSGVTNGDITVRGADYEGGPSIGDIDGDGAADLVGVASDSGQVVVVDQQGQTLPGFPLVVGVSALSSVALGDLDHDGRREMVYGSFTTPAIHALRWDGTEWMDGDSNPSTVGVFKTLGMQYNIGTPAIADLDGNGELDIVYGAFEGKLYAWRPGGASLPGFPITLPEPISSSVAVGYLDGPTDTQLDIVVTTGFYPNSTPTKDSLYVFTATGARRSGFPKVLRSSDNIKAPSPALADMNNDTFVDIVVASTNGKLYVYDRAGNTVGPWNGIAFSSLTGTATEASPSVADIDGDGLNDVVIGDETGNLTAIGGTGLVLPGFPIPLGSSVASAAALCDCDADGKTEIVLAGSDRHVSMWDYDFPFSPAGRPPWPQFHHDALRTGLATNPAFVSAEPPAPSGPVAGVELEAPSPNPSRGSAALWYAIPRAGGRLELAVFDLSGRRVCTIERGMAQAGRFRAEWNVRDDAGRRVEPGLYFIRLNLDLESRSQKIIVVH